MNLHRIWALTLRYLYVVRDPTRMAEFLFWPVVDIGFYGLIASWMSSYVSQVVPMFVIPLVLWQLIYRSNYEVCVNVIDEFWEYNIFNLVASPLTHWDWVFAMMFSGLLKIGFTFTFGSSLAWFLFGVNIFSLGWTLISLITLCILSGWIIGFLAGGVLIYSGPKIQQLPWLATALLALFSTIYYPLSILPSWMQSISQSIPSTYIFEGTRNLLRFGTLPPYYLAFAFTLSFLYLFLAIRFFIFMFNKSKQNGFPRTS